MAIQYLAFTEDQRREFAGIMYELMKPLTENVKPAWNPKYLEYVERTGNTGALNYMTNAQ